MISTRLTDMSYKLVSAAIVIGNEECRYGFSFSCDRHSNTLDIFTDNRPSHERIQTCVLFTKDKVFHSFGYKSKNKYEELLEDEEHEDWYFFERFLSRFTLQGVRKYISYEV